MKKGKLYLVGLPVGNWEDMPPRALRYIKTAKNIVMESHQAFEMIWPALGIEKPDANFITIQMLSYGGEPGKSYELENMQQILDLLEAGEDVHIISDDGMPGVADPGELITKQAIAHGIEVTATPGPSVAIAAVAVAGCMHNFTFESFLPFTKEERMKYIAQRKYLHAPMVFVLRNVIGGPDNKPAFHPEIPEFLKEASEILGSNRRAVLCYNLTKPNERVVRGTLQELKEYFDRTPREQDLITIVIDTEGGSFDWMGIMEA
jgi:16S rRNA (cytidine1402-2'-O)-methyltransferase